MTVLAHKLPDDLTAALLSESNRALRVGAFYGMLLAVIPVVILPVYMQAGLARMLFAPWLFAVLGGAFSGLIYFLAKHEQVRGLAAWCVFIPFVSMPTLFLLVANATTPADVVLSVSGPFTYIYGFALVVTGFMFNFWLSAVSGLVAAIGYFGGYWLVRDHLVALQMAGGAPDQLLANDSIFAAKALIICFCGMAVGALALVARRLTVRAIFEERDKALVSRLFGEYVSEEVKQKLLRDPAAQRGETKDVVVLFSDIRNYTSFSEATEPAQIVARLNDYFDAMVDAITSH
ncbi:MAG: hypothetical protein JXR83_14100, partial [Deltaproteobacteria bacterium]|nr:hypothetical protein [Deltaproteobacteria bacterium]